MKKNILRLLSLALCITMVFALFPAQADAAGNSYSTRSSKKVLLVFPSSGKLLSEPLYAKVDGEQKNGGIYYYPKKSTDNGVLGTVKNGTKVTIFAEDDGYYFFMTNSGRMGWNKKKFFTEPSKYSGYYIGNSGLTTDHLKKVKSFLASNDRAGGSNKFYPSKPVIILDKGDSAKFTIYGDYRKSSTVHMRYDGDLHTLKSKSGNGKLTITIKGKTMGTNIIEFTNYYTDRVFEVLVIVV